jgi:TatA/E family protein of Tat protein translocase
MIAPGGVCMIGSLGIPELLFIFVLALLVFGPKRLPEMGRMIGKGMAEFRKATNELKRTINAEIALEEEEQTPAARRPLNPVNPATVPRSAAPAAAVAPAEISPMAALGSDVVVVPASASDSGGEPGEAPAEAVAAGTASPAGEPR